MFISSFCENAYLTHSELVSGCDINIYLHCLATLGYTYWYHDIYETPLPPKT